MKALVDTNVVLDAIASREPFRERAEKIFLLAAEEEFEGYITAASVTDICCVARKFLPDRDVRESLRRLLRIFQIADVRGADCEAALDMPLEDYEDAVIAASGHRAGVDCIVTRDDAFLRSPCPICTLSPDAFLEKMQSS